MSVKVKENKPGGQCKSLKSTSVLLNLGSDLGLDRIGSRIGSLGTLFYTLEPTAV